MESWRGEDKEEMRDKERREERKEGPGKEGKEDWAGKERERERRELGTRARRGGREL